MTNNLGYKISARKGILQLLCALLSQPTNYVDLLIEIGCWFDIFAGPKMVCLTRVVVCVENGMLLVKWFISSSSSSSLSSSIGLLILMG